MMNGAAIEEIEKQALMIARGGAFYQNLETQKTNAAGKMYNASLARPAESVKSCAI
jgi:hypothetical protein